MKSEYCNSTTGRMPSIAAPMAMPVKVSSDLGGVREPRLGVLRVERAPADAAAGRSADHERQRHATPIVVLAGNGDQLVERARDEVGVLQLDHRPHALHRGSDGDAREGIF